MHYDHRKILRILSFLAFAAVTLEPASITCQAEGKGPEPMEKHSLKVLDIQRTTVFTRLAGALHDMLQAAGQTEWSPARLQGVLGNAFSFEMRNGGGMVWQEGNLDWWSFFESRPELEFGCRILRFQARQGDAQGEIARTKAAAWEAVRVSIDQGVPAAALCPMSPQQNAARDWGLLIGYDEADATYTIRRHGGEFKFRFDAIGHAEPKELFCVLVYDGREPDATTDVHIRALQNAVAFANGTRYDPNGAAFHVDARGFAAYELWREAIETGTSAFDQRHPRSVGPVGDSDYHAGELRVLRRYAAAYLRELVDIFPAAAADLERAARHYDQVVDASARLSALCGREKEVGVFSADARIEASALIGYSPYQNQLGFRLNSILFDNKEWSTAIKRQIALG